MFDPVPAPPRSRRWTLPELTQLSHMAAEGATADQIAAALGRTVAAIRMKAAQQRVPIRLTGRQQEPPVWRALREVPPQYRRR